MYVTACLFGFCLSGWENRDGIMFYFKAEAQRDRTWRRHVLRPPWPQQTTDIRRSVSRAMVLGDVRRLILATDMTRHAEYIATIDKLRPPETAPAPPPVLQAAALAAAAYVVTPETAGAAGCDDSDRSPTHPATGLVRDGAGEAARRRRLVGELLLKCADTSNVLRPFPAARRWAVRAIVCAKAPLADFDPACADSPACWVWSALLRLRGAMLPAPSV